VIRNGESAEGVNAMPAEILQREVDALLKRGAILVDVLPRQEFGDMHLPGAINIPLRELDGQTTAHLDHDRPLIVYCAGPE
jgi:rhodanese-related sulfurtransferase